MTLVTNLLLALVWAALIGPFSPANLLAGFVVGYAILFLGSAGGARSRYVRSVAALLGLVFFTVADLTLANLRVAWYTVTPLRGLRPAVLAVPLREDLSDVEIMTLANLITLTPGSLSLDVAPDRSCLYVHFMHVDDPEASIRSIKEGFERRILQVTRT
jgi:multicomponent Na+:H+ antiporter subunit E